MSGKHVEVDQTPHSAAFDLGLHCFLRPVCPNSQCYYGIRNLASDLIKINLFS